MPQPTQEEIPCLLVIMRTARERDLICKALYSFRVGGPDGLFDAYEALT